jgi:hypothetical protein
MVYVLRHEMLERGERFGLVHLDADHRPIMIMMAFHCNQLKNSHTENSLETKRRDTKCWRYRNHWLTKSIFQYAERLINSTEYAKTIYNMKKTMEWHKRHYSC